MSLARLCDLLGDGPDSSFEPIKHGTPADDELQGLGDEIGGQWLMLGRRLGVRDKELQEINQAHVLLGEKGYYMLKHWKRKEGSAATYKAVCDALKHERVRRPDLVEKFCHIKGISSPGESLLEGASEELRDLLGDGPDSSFEPIKHGTPTDDELEGLGFEIGAKWGKLGRRLHVRDQNLQEINLAHDELSEKGYYMLKHWKGKEGSAATYKALCDALKHEFVRRPDLAVKFCHIKGRDDPSGIWSPRERRWERAIRELILPPDPSLFRGFVWPPPPLLESKNELKKDSTMTTPKFNENQGNVEGIVNYEGGVLFAEDVQVICPNGAISKLDDHVAIKVVLEKPSTHCDMIVKNGLENEVMFIAPVINLQPNGQVFKKPVTLQTKLTTETDVFRRSDVLILHGTQATDGKIVWEDITHQSKIDLEKKELKVEIKQFSRIAALLRLTSILAKDVVTRLNLLGFNYTLSVLFKDNHPHSPFGELALVFMSHDVYHEMCYREHPSSVLMQLKGNGYEKLCSIDRPESNRIYNNENLKVSLLLGQDYNLTDGQLESTVEVDSSTWWSTGHVIKLSLKGTDGARILCGKIGIEGQYGHILEETFCELDTCEYVRRLLRVEGSILNLVPIARKLEVPEEGMNEAINSWQNDEEQLKLILQNWAKRQEEERCKDDPAMLRNTLQGLNSEDCEVNERGKMHINHLRELAFEIRSLNRQDPHLMEYFTNQIRSLCDSVLKDCCIELDAEVSVENYPRFLSIRQQVTEDVAMKLETICSSSTRSINEDFFSIVPFLIQAIKDIFRKENHQPIVQNGLKGLPKEIVSQHESKVRDAFLKKDILKLVYELCRVLESLCLNNCEKHSTEVIENWSESLGIWNMSEFLKEFFQSRQDSKLYKRLQLFSRSLRRITEDVRKIKEIEMRYSYNVSLNLIKFATFDPSKLVRFEITDCTNSPVTCYSEAIKYDRPHDTFSQQFEVRKESEDELQLGAIARVHLDGRIRQVGAFESVIVLPTSSKEKLASRAITTLPVAVKAERTGSGDLRVVLSSTRRKTISEALCVLQRELRDDIVNGGQIEITESHLTVCCFVEAVGMVRLRLLYKWRSEAISVDSKDFVAIGESSATDAFTSASDSGVTNSSSPLEAELTALSIASRLGDNNGDFVMDPSAIEIIQTHARQQCGRLELHLHQTIQKGQVCVTGENTSLHMEMPKTAQRFLQAGLCAPSQKSITAGSSSKEGAVSDPQKNQSIDMEEIEDKIS